MTDHRDPPSSPHPGPRIRFEPDWEAAARALTGLLAEPAAVLNRELRIVATNADLRRLLGADGPHLQGQRLDEALGLGRRIAKPPGKGVKRRPVRCVGRGGRPFDAILYLRRASPDTSAFIAALHPTVARETAGRPTSAIDEYEISAGTRTFGHLQRVRGSDGKPLQVQDKARCYTYFYGREEPCSRCPALVHGGDVPERSALLEPELIGPYRLVQARRTRRGFLLRVTDIDDAAASTLQQVRIERLAAHANLSEREREVLQLLLVGLTLTEIGGFLGISERTVRFHQTNLLEKLGADSRMDLLRIVL